MMPSVKGLHYALRIWTRQIFGLVIMMPYPLPLLEPGVLHQPQCSCILPSDPPPLAARSAFLFLTHAKPSPAANAVLFFVPLGALKAAVKKEKLSSHEIFPLDASQVWSAVVGFSFSKRSH